MINVQGLTTVLAHIREHESEWRQDEWTNCFAGHTVRLLADATEVPSGCCERCEPQGLMVSGEPLAGHYIGIRAAELLGLTAVQAERLFHATNTLEGLTRWVKEFTTEKDMAPDMALAA